MCPRRYIFEDDTLEIAGADIPEINEHIVTVVCQVLVKYLVPKKHSRADSC